MPEPQTDANKIYRVTITTDRGTIVMDLDPQLAPNTVNNFIGLARRGLLRRPHVPPGGARVRDPGRLPRGQRPRRPRLQVRRRAGEGRVHARRGRDGERRARHERITVLHLHRRLHPQAHAELQPVRLRRRRHRRRAGHARSATRSTSSRSKSAIGDGRRASRAAASTRP